MKRILHIVSHLKKNGTETFIMNLYRAIDRNLYQFDFLTFSPEKEGFYEEILKLGGNVYFLPSRKEGITKYHHALNDFFLTHGNNYTTIHYHVSSLSSVAPLYYAKKHQIKQRILHMHSANCTGFHNKILHHLNKLRISSLATDFVGCSKAACQWGYKNTSVFHNSVVITNGIDLNKFYPDNKIRKKTREALGLNSNPIILHVGTFNPIKNHKFLIDTFSYIVNSLPDARLICVGTGNLLGKTKIYASKTGVGNKVIFAGRRDDIADIMRAADIFVLPSLYEGLGIVLIEAQATGLKVIASTGVPSETKVNQSTIYLPLSDGPQIWAEKIVTTLSSVNNTISPSINQCSINTTVEQILSIYSLK